MAVDNIERLIVPVATELWGQPRKGATKTEIRFGDGRTVNPKTGVWFDHNAGGNGEGGGVVDLIQKETGRKGRDAMEWLVEKGFLQPGDLDDNRPAQRQEKKTEEGKRTLAKAWDYTNENGEVLYQTLRYQWKMPDGSWRIGKDGKTDKTYSQRRKPQPDDDPEDIRDGWVYKLGGIRIVPYRLPEILEAIAMGSTIFFVEGEKAADRLWEIGIPATCNPMGSGKWWPELNAYFDDADVVILPDNDPQATKKDGSLRFHDDGRPVFVGQDHAQAVAGHLKEHAKRLRILDLPDLPPKGDADDWIEAGGTADDLYDLAERKARNPDAPVFKSLFGARWLHEARTSKPQRNWLVKNLILAKTMGIVYGPPGCGKSFLVSDMMLTFAAGDLLAKEDDASFYPEWFGYRGKKFGVIYVVAEGSDDFEIRLHAWLADKGIGDDAVLPFVFLPTNVDMRTNDADTKKLVAEIKGISAMMQEQCGVDAAIVVIDTVARALSGGNENDSSVMSAFVTNCGTIQHETGATVLGVHHGGKEGGRGPRGHEALHGAADFEIEVSAATEDTPNIWTVRKLKAGPGGAQHRFRLRQTTVGQDDDGDAITSCIVVGYGASAQKSKEEPKGWKVNDNEREFLEALAEAIDQKGVMPPPDVKAPSNVLLAVKSDDVRKVFFDKYHATESGDEEAVEARLRQRWSRATKGLLRFKIIGSQKPWLWFTGKEVQRFRVRGVQAADQAPSCVEPEAPPADIDFSSYARPGGLTEADEIPL